MKESLVQFLRALGHSRGMFRRMTWVILIVFSLVLTGAIASFSSGHHSEASRESAGLSPDPNLESEAVVQVFAARAFGWRRPFGLHTWISTKDKNADHYLVYQVIGWRVFRGLNSVRIEKGTPDGRWFGAEPDLLVTLKGETAEAAIKNISQAAERYSFGDRYWVWPGPNSNTFISYLIRKTPELRIELPPHAIGKDWMPISDFFSKTESGTGYQLSLYGIFGMAMGLNEGVEVNILGLNFGIDFLRPALKLPFIGRLGMRDSPV